MCWKATFVVATLCLVTASEAQIRIQLQREEVAPKTEVIKPQRKFSFFKTTNVPQILKNYKNVYYYGYVRIGTPGDLVRVIFDTGSPSLWVYSGSGWRSWLCIPCWFHKTYHHSRSSTYVPDGRSIEISYVSGYMNGYVSQDVLKVGKLISTVSLAEATDVPLMDSLTKYDGVLGLAPCSGSECSVYKTFTPSVVNPILSQLSRPIFSVYLNRENDGYGEIMFGGTNTDLYKAETLAMHNTSSHYMWAVHLESVWVGEHMVLNYSRGVNAFIDTGTSLIVGPPVDVAALLMALNLNPWGPQITCNNFYWLPPISFVIGGQKYTLSGQQYASLSTKTFWGSKTCYHGLQAMDLGSKAWILGDIFLSNFYTVFEVGDHSALRIGFAQLK